MSFEATAIDRPFASLMNEGNDPFSLENTASLLSLVVNVGADTDTFIDNLGNPHPFPETIVNLP